MTRTIELKDPSRFKDPANLTWERYIALQARERAGREHTERNDGDDEHSGYVDQPHVAPPSV